MKCLRNFFTLLLKDIQIEKNKGFWKLLCTYCIPITLIVVPSLINFLIFLMTLFAPNNLYITNTDPVSGALDCHSYQKPVETYCNNWGKSINYTRYTFRHNNSYYYHDKNEKRKENFTKDFLRIPRCLYINYVDEGETEDPVECNCYMQPVFNEVEKEIDRNFLKSNEIKSCSVNINEWSKENLDVEIIESNPSTVSYKFMGDDDQILKKTMNDIGFGNDIFHLLTRSIFENITKSILPYGVKVIPQTGQIVKYAQLTFFFVDETKSFMDLMSIFLFPLALSFLFPYFSGRIIQEKKKGLASHLQLFSVTYLENELSRFCFDYFCYFVFVVFSIIVPLIFQSDFFIKSKFYHYSLLFLCYGFALISFSYLFSWFNKNHYIGVSTGYMLMIIFTIMGASIVFFYPSNQYLPWYFMLFPPFILIRGIAFCIATYKLNVIRPISSEIWIILLCMIGESIIFMCVYIFLEYFSDYVNSFWIRLKRIGEYVTSKGKKRRREKESLLINENDPLLLGNQQHVVNEVENDPEEYILRINSVNKKFGRKQVLKNVCLKIKPKECFVLIGANGSGKTTLSNIILGILAPSSGNAKFVSPKKMYDCTLDKKKVQERVSVCPQFDKLFDLLTVKETIQFYTRLRGIKWKNQSEYVDKIIKEVNLQEYSRQLAKNLSGGCLRRLSIATSIISKQDQGIVILDEPSTGLDPAACRSVWEVIEKIKKTKSVLLTTHSMLEAESLGDRVAIIDNGVILCVDSINNMKMHYGKGNILKIVSYSVNYFEEIEKYISSNLEISEKKKSGCSIVFRIPSSVKLSRIFEVMDEKKIKKVGIKSYSISQSSLEEVFLGFVDQQVVNDKEEPFEKKGKGIGVFDFLRIIW